MLPRNRIIYAVAIVIVIAVGLASRTTAADEFLPAWLANFSGDTLWALMVFLIFGFLFPKAKTAIIAGAALAFSFGIEFSQLYQAEWLNPIRQTQIGALILGSGFLKSDLICYTVGIFIGVIFEFARRCCSLERE